MLLGVVGAVLAQNVQLGSTVQNAFFSEPRNLETDLLRGLVRAHDRLAAGDRPRSEGPIPLRPDLVDGIAGHHADSVLAIRALGRRLHRRA